VLACDLKEHSDSDGATYRVEAAYAYEVNGVRYTGDRVSLHSGSDNIGRFHQRTYGELRRRMERKEPVPCWVNPDDPSDAVLIRRPRPEMIGFSQLFVFVFGGAGLGVVLAGCYLLLNRVRAAAGDGLIRMNGARTHLVLAAVAALWNGYAGWLLWTLWRVLAPEPVPWYLWLLAAIGLVLAGVAAYWCGRLWKFGVSEFALSPSPGVVGGPVSGMIRIPVKADVPDGFELTLQCFRRTTTRQGGESSTTTETLWEEARHHVQGYSYGEDTQVPVRFDVPYDQPETTAEDGDGCFWRLTATAEAPGIDYKAVFEVPVKKTAQSVAGPAPRPVAESLGPVQIGEVAERLGLRLEARADGGLELACPAARAKAMIAFLLIFTALWTGICYVLWCVGDAPLPLSIIFSFFDVLLYAILADMLFVSRGIRVDRSQRVCVVWSRFAGVPVRERRVPFQEVLDFRCERSAQSGNTVYFRISLLRQGGRVLTVASNLSAWNDAGRLVEALRKRVVPDSGK